MALATTCPSCKTSFKVLSEQLKLRRGMVRCGICQQVFSGVEYLRYVNDTRASSRQADDNPQTVAADLNTAFFLPETRFATGPDDEAGPTDEIRQPAPIRKRRVRRTPPISSPDWPGIDDDHPAWAQHREKNTAQTTDAEGGDSAGAGVIRGGDEDDWPSTMVWPRPPDDPPGGGAAPMGQADAHADRAPDSAPSRAAPPPFIMRSRHPAPPPLPSQAHEDGPLAAAADDDADEAVDFFGRSTNPAFDFDLPPRGVWIAAGALSVLLVFQVLIGAREVIAAHLPSMRGALSTLSAPFGLAVGMPIRAEAITIESFDLARAPEGQSRFRLNMLLRNRAGMTLRWPSIELTLTDSTGGILVRKALQPQTYLGDDSLAQAGMNGESEQVIRLTLETADIVPSGYSAVLFYH
ncbi:MAG: zinc-ribbon and DUF3426 domain-containing protein [Burkholderiaceae bacterium]